MEVMKLLISSCCNSCCNVFAVCWFCIYFNCLEVVTFLSTGLFIHVFMCMLMWQLLTHSNRVAVGQYPQSQADLSFDA